MGFYIHMLVAHPHKYKTKKGSGRSRGRSQQAESAEIPPKEYTLWRIKSILAVGRVTRMEKLTAERFEHIRDSFDPQQRAGVCLVDSIFPKLTKPLNQPKKSLFAPRFATDGTGQLTSYLWREQNLTSELLQGGEEFIEPIEAHLGERTIPEHEHLAEHNSVIQLGEEEFKAKIDREYEVVYSRPFMWESCTTVAEWLRLMETENVETWKVLSYDPKAVEYIHAWRSYLTHMGKIDARVVFVFEALDVFSVL